MTIIIADDERIVRLGLISMLEELYPAANTYLEAKNGYELVSLVQEYHPPVIFVDIKMPVKDGLTAIREVGEKSPGTKCIILTGYSEFEYAKKAISLNVLDYLVKPVGPEDLSKVVEKVSALLAAERQSALARFEQQVSSALRSPAVFAPAPPDQAASGGSYTVLVLETAYARRDDPAECHARLEELFSAEYVRQSNTSFRYAVQFLEPHILCVVFCAAQPVSGDCLGKLQMLSAKMEKEERPFSALFKQGAKSMEEVHAACFGMLRLLPLCCIRGFGQVTEYRNFAALPDFERLQQFAAGLRGIAAAFLNSDEINYKAAINGFYREPANRQTFARVEKTYLRRFLRASMNFDADLQTYEGFVRQLIECNDAIFRPSGKPVPNNVVAWVKEYVEDHYMEGIGINSMADLVGLTPNYLSKLFHDITGQKFIDYISDVRISNAKKIIMENDGVNVKEVSQRVGYTDSRHFAKVFHKLTGEYPSEFRKAPC